MSNSTAGPHITGELLEQFDDIVADSYYENMPNISSAIFETALYGVLFILAPITLYILMHRPEESFSSSRKFSKVVTIICAIQLCATTVVRSIFLDWNNAYYLHSTGS